MAWLVVDKNGDEWIFLNKPIRINSEWVSEDNKVAQLREGESYYLLGKIVHWEDEPIEI